MNSNNALDNAPDTEIESQDIAIIGMAAHFPGAATIDEFWNNLHDGVESIVSYSDEALSEDGVPASQLKDPSYVKAGAPLTDMEMFDASFFGFSPKEAMILDPQHRHFLECVWEALEHAGYDPERYDGAIGLFGGSGHNAYLPYNLLSNPELVKSVGFFLLRHTGNDKDFLTTRASYIFNLRGPSIAVQTACSTSLVAIHTACQSLLSGESDMALAGGATIELPHRHGYTYKEGEILSPDGHCRTFDAQSKGTVFGSGAGIVVLKKLEDAIADGDTVHAVIKGSAINNDGSMKMGYLAPSVEGQAAAVDEAIAISDIDPTSIRYIETHGTGTPVGDPIEISALTQAYRNYTDDTQFCAVGSVKTNIGHLDTAAGVASVIKVVESLKHQQIPASLHYTSPNPSIDFENSPFYVNNHLTEWENKSGEPRRAAVNSLGVGGTNAHAILEEAPEQAPTSNSREFQLLVLSAKSQSALDSATDNLAHYLKQHLKTNLADAAHTLRIGRKEFSQRRVLVCNDVADAISALESRDPKRVFSFSSNNNPPAISFMFTGQGAQYAGMGRDLYQSEKTYKQIIDQCAEILKSDLGFDLRDVLFPEEDKEAEANERLQQTSITQPALFVTEYALASLWNSWGIEAQAMIGHSVGEYAAACLAGVFSLEDGLSLVAARGRLMESMPAGDMLAIALPEDEVMPLLGDCLSLAAINAEGMSVVSGEADAVEMLRADLEKKEVTCRMLHTSHAFHSAMMEPILEKFEKLFDGITLRVPSKPFVSNTTGTWITQQQATSPEYWVNHLRGTVRFADGISCLLKEPGRLLLEVGPGNTLVTFARQNSNKSATQTVLNSMRHPKEQESDTVFLLNALGRLWMAGVAIDNKVFEGAEVRRRIPLPTYPFEKQRFWVEPGKGSSSTEVASVTDKLAMDEWFYQATWQQTPSFLSHVEIKPQAQMVIFLGDDKFGLSFVTRLKTYGVNVVTITNAGCYSELASGEYQFNPEQKNEYELLFKAILAKGEISHVINLWNVSIQNSFDVASTTIDKRLDNSFYHLVYLVQALGKLDGEKQIQLLVFSEGMQQVAGEKLTSPDRATIQGVCKVANSEFPSLNCSSIDIRLTDSSSKHTNALLDCVVMEALNPNEDVILAYRGEHRFVQTFQRTALLAGNDTTLRDNGVYLITGGLGGLGLDLAKQLVDKVNAKLALLSRSALPARDEWEQWLDRHAVSDNTSQKIRQVQQLEEKGTKPLLIVADVNDFEQMKVATEKITETLGTINGVFHTAGILNDGLISLKTKPALALVLGPKIHGTLVLDRLFANENLDFCLLYSSVSSIAGVAGQVDYTAANAFLNAFSHFRRDNGGTPMISVNWGAWQKIGMAARLAENIDGDNGAGNVIDHPFYKTHHILSPQTEEFQVELSAEKYWVLDQHRTKAGISLVPGTGYLEFARAAYDARGSGIPVEIQNVFFMSPFAIKDNEKKMLAVKLEYDGEKADFTVQSRGYDAGVAWCDEHVQGSISYLPETNETKTLDILPIISRCTKQHIDMKGIAEHPHLAFGERWENIDCIDFGDAEAVISMNLPERFQEDFALFSLHPALLDMATGAAQSLIPGFDAQRNFLVPISYSKVKIFSPLESRMYSHVRYSKDAESMQIALFDITITDQKGRILVDIEHFVMKQVDHSALASIGERPAQSNPAQTNSLPSSSDIEFATKLAAAGLLPDEGYSAIERILTARCLPQVIVSPVDFQAFLFESKSTGEGGLSDEESVDDASDGIDRPNIPTVYAEPSGDVEPVIAKVWQNALGINKVGVHDNFFELGGHSLLLTQIVARVRKQLKRELPLSDVFELPTIAEWAEIVGDVDQGNKVKGVPEVMPVDREKYSMTRTELKKAAGY